MITFTLTLATAMWQDHAVSDKTYDEAQDAALEQLAAFLAEDKENVNRYTISTHPSIRGAWFDQPLTAGFCQEIHASLCSATFVIIVHGV
jgi:hypothetical protein